MMILRAMLLVLCLAAAAAAQQQENLKAIPAAREAAEKMKSVHQAGRNQNPSGQGTGIAVTDEGVPADKAQRPPTPKPR